MTSSKSFFDAVKDRRSIYALNKESPISDEAIEELVKQTVLHAPSFFNTQSARLVVLLKKEHDIFWDMVKEVLKPMVSEDQFAATEQRLSMFRGGYGTVSLYQTFSFHFTAVAQFETVKLMTFQYLDPLL